MDGGWSALKRELSDNGVLDDHFVNPLEEKFLTPSADFAVPANAYYPMLIDQHLRDVSSHLDRVLSYRKEMQDLEVLAVRAGADYALQREQAQANYDLALVRLRTGQLATEFSAQQRAVTEFGKASAEVAGFREIAAGAADRAKFDLRDSDIEARLLKELFERDRDYQERYWQRHNERGNAHNFAERSLQLLKLVQQDMMFARAKCKALEQGFRAIYGRASQMPLPANDSPIDDLVLWVRSLFEDIGLEDGQESEFDVVLPFVQKLGNLAPLTTPTAWKTAIDGVDTGKKFRLEFELKEEHLLGRKQARLKRVGLTYGTMMYVEPNGIDRKATYESYCRYRGEASPPMPSFPGVTFKRPPITLGGISVYGGPVDYSDGPEVANLNPLGKWTVLIDPYPTTKEVETRTFKTGSDGSTAWIDLKLHLRLRAKGAL